MKKEVVDCEYEKRTKSGLDCPCEECAKIRDFLFQGEITGDFYISGLSKDKAKIRR